MDFKNIKLRVVTLLFLPLIFESSTIVLVSLLRYPQMSVEIAYTFAFTMAPVATSMILPTMLAMFEGHYGTHKKLPQTLVPALVLDDTLSILMHQIMIQIVLNNHP